MSSFVTGDGVALNYTDTGAAGATTCPVVLVAGHTAPLATWQLFADALVAAGHRVVAVDRRHCGASDFPAHGMRMTRQGADLHELLVHLQLDAPVVVGSSLGANALLAMVDVFGDAALGGLVLVDQTPKMVNDAEWRFGLYDLTWETLDEFVAVFGTDAASPDRFQRAAVAPPAAEALAVVAGAFTSPYPHADVRPLLRDHAVADWRDVVARLSVPTLAVGGRHSELWPVAHAEWIAAHAPRGELLLLEHSGHAPMWSEPAAFADAILGFIARLA